MSNMEVQRIRIELLESQRRRVLEAIEKGHLTDGEAKEELIDRLSVLFNRKYVVLVSNGFSAILASLLARYDGIPRKIATAAGGTCFAMVNAIKATGSKPIFADLDCRTASPGIDEIVEISEEINAAVIPNHFGYISECNRKGLDNIFLIEDAAQSFSSSRKNKSKADVTTLSFYPTKIINGIDGGAILTDNEEIFRKAKESVSYDDQYKYEDRKRFNLKFNNLHAAYTLGSLDNLVNLETSLKKSFDMLSVALKNRKLRVLEPKVGEIPTKLMIDCTNLAQRNALLKNMNKQGIHASKEVLWLVRENDNKDDYLGTKAIVDGFMSIPFHPYLEEYEIENIINAIHLVEH